MARIRKSGGEMREIIFRGKRVDNNEWYYGYLLQPNIISNVVSGQLVYADLFVDENTVGQYTGLKDKNGTKIFEGDIVKYYQDENRLNYGIIEYKDCYFGIKPITKSLPQLIDIAVKWHNGEVIGNVFDNSELLKQFD